MPIKKAKTNKLSFKGGGSTPYLARTRTAFRPLAYRKPLRKPPMEPHRGATWGHVADLANNLADSVGRISKDLQRDQDKKLNAAQNRAFKYYEEAATRRADDLFRGKTNWKQIRNDEQFIRGYADRYGLEHDQAQKELNYNFKKWGGINYNQLTDTVYRTKTSEYEGRAKDFTLDAQTRKRAKGYLGDKAEKELFKQMRTAIFERDIRESAVNGMALRKEMFTDFLMSDLKEMEDKGQLNRSEVIALRDKVSSAFMKSQMDADKMRTYTDILNNQTAIYNETGGKFRTRKGLQDRSQRELIKIQDAYNSQMSRGTSTPTQVANALPKVFNSNLHRGENIKIKSMINHDLVKRSDQAVDAVFKSFIPTGVPHAQVLAENRHIRSDEGREFAEKVVRDYARTTPGGNYEAVTQAAGANLEMVTREVGVSDFTTADSDIPLVRTMQIMGDNPDFGKNSPGGILSKERFIGAFNSVEKLNKYKQDLSTYLDKDISRDEDMKALKRHLKEMGLYQEPVVPPPPPPPSLWDKFKAGAKKVGKAIIKPFSEDKSGNANKKKTGKSPAKK